MLHDEPKLANRLAPLELAPGTADPGLSIGPVAPFPFRTAYAVMPLALDLRSP